MKIYFFINNLTIHLFVNMGYELNIIDCTISLEDEEKIINVSNSWIKKIVEEYDIQFCWEFNNDEIAFNLNKMKLRRYKIGYIENHIKVLIKIMEGFKTTCT